MLPRQAELFKILGVESRLGIIELLKVKGPLGVNDLSQALGITPSAVSQHLKILKQAGLVRNERKGYWIPYKVNVEALEQCQMLLSKVCSCGCKESARIRQGPMAAATDNLHLLKKRERQLQQELNDVRCRIEALEEHKP